jgi:hypothetical protein
MKISLGINKKVGLPNYGSAGSLCTIDLDLDDSLLNTPDEFQRRVQNAYGVARQCVESELAHHRPNQSNGQPSRQPEPKQEQRNENPTYGNQSSGQRYIASPKQLSFIASLTKNNRIDRRKLEKFCDSKFGKGSSQLSPKEASELIDILRGGGGEVMSA